LNILEHLEGISDEDEVYAIFAAATNAQELIDKIRWATIDGLIRRGILCEVALPYRSKNRETEIRLVSDVTNAKQSTNRI